MSSHIQPILGPVARDRDGKVTNVANHAEDTTFPEKGDEGVGFLWLPYERSQLGWLKNYTYSLTVGRPESETKVSAGLGALQRHGASVRPSRSRQPWGAARLAAASPPSPPLSPRDFLLPVCVKQTNKQTKIPVLEFRVHPESGVILCQDPSLIMSTKTLSPDKVTFWGSRWR